MAMKGLNEWMGFKHKERKEDRRVQNDECVDMGFSRARPFLIEKP